jgi:single-strand DNA-binding protein
MLNEILIIGRLGKTPELKVTPSGAQVTSFGVATSEKWTKDGQKHEETTWHNVVIWGKNAESACKYMKKGELHLFKGTMKYEKYEKDGVEKIAPKIHVTTFKLLPNGQSNSGHTPEEPGNSAAYTGGRSSDEPDMSQGQQSNSNISYDNDEIPF